MREIQTARGMPIIADDADYDWLSRYRWCVLKNGYASARINGVPTYMHRAILGLGRGEICDHINGVRLDNQRSNLRRCTRKENNTNKRKRDGCASQYKGMYWHKTAKKWHASIKVDGIVHSLGYWSDPVFAARLYDAQAKRYHGAFARLNFPDAQ